MIRAGIPLMSQCFQRPLLSVCPLLSWWSEYGLSGECICTVIQIPGLRANWSGKDFSKSQLKYWIFIFFFFQNWDYGVFKGTLRHRTISPFSSKQRARSDAAGPLKLKPVLMAWCQRGDCWRDERDQEDPRGSLNPSGCGVSAPQGRSTFSSSMQT